MTTRVEFCHASVVGPNPDKFDAPITLRLVLEVFERPPLLPIDIKFVWSPIWDFSVDQTLDELEVGPLGAVGRHEFVLQSDPPDYAQIPDPTGPTALLISLSYKGHEFLHIGYNVVVSCKGELPDEFTSADKLVREIGLCFPKQTPIAWDDEVAADTAQ